MKRNLTVQSITINDANFIEEAFNLHIQGSITINFESCGNFEDLLISNGNGKRVVCNEKLMEYLSKTNKI